MFFAYVVLHYNVIEDTIQCVESIQLSNKGLNYAVVIVDNQSPDGSGAELDFLYESNKNIKIIHAEKNEGFARGNNIGFKYAKYTLKADFIILQNNDTKILQDNFQYLVLNEFINSRFAVLGPLIETPRKPYNSNPGPNNLDKIKSFRNERRKYLLHLFLTYLNMDNIFTKKIYRRLKPISDDRDDIKVYTRVENVMLHGSFLIFSPTYIQLFDGLNERTFMFFEEELLFHRIQTNCLKSVYNPSIKVFHKEDASTNSLFTKENRKMRFIYRNKYNSLKVLIDEMENTVFLK